MDERGIEPRAFPMRRERDTPTPHTQLYESIESNCRQKGLFDKFKYISS
jgi:hypothetical protein